MWLAEKVLNYLLGRASEAVQTKLKDVQQDKERGEVNEANVRAYQDAVDREARRKAALYLVNRTRP